MKHFTLYIGLATALVASCSTQEKDFQTPQQDDVIFYASFEQPAEEGTRVYANEDLLLRWTADDRVSIFNKLTYNQQYKFTGETGDNAGGFDKVAGSEFATGNTISHVVSVYPYQETTKITESEVLTLTLPAEQHYVENTFGLGANTMVSVTTDNVLQYKTVGGYLVFKLYGDGVSVSSITLKGNNGEKLAGKATITMPVDGVPTVSLADDATDAITLVCDSPVALGATAEESTLFWLVVPPVTFSKGFTVTLSGSGGVFEKSTEKTVTIERNKLSKMSPIEVELTPTQPRNVIYYTSTDGNVVAPSNPDAFGATILSNEYVDGLGVITFDEDVTSIGEIAFRGCTSLTGITIPDSVTSIGDWAFSNCTSLSSITIPDSVTSIGNGAFNSCTSLSSIMIPDSVTSIGDGAFARCSSLQSFSGKYSSPDGLFLIDSGNTLIAVALGAINGEVTIPEGVTSIGNSAFISCTSLTSITIPESVISIGSSAFVDCTSLSSITISAGVISIGNGAFGNCTSLTSITIPDSVTSIGNSAFARCTSLTGITIPDSVTSIGDWAFSGCTSLTSITIPDSVTSIGGGVFSDCTSLTSITIPDSVTSIGGGAFQYCSSLTNITIPDSVTSIGNFAFYSCTSLTSIMIPDSVTSIGDWAFQNCSSLTSITVKPEVPPTGSRSMFYDTNDCPIYVPAESVEAYKSAQFWSDYADRIQAIPSSSVPVPEAVDLGLPSGLKWASFNLGATKPEEIGYFYRWGETEPRQENENPFTNPQEFYKWSVGVKYGMNTFYYLTKYCQNSDYGYNGFCDNKTVLDPEDDAARVNLGGKWRMPTDAEWAELLDNCSWVYTLQTGGRTVTGPNGNSIFFPSISKESITGWFWTSILDTNDYTSSSARCAYFDDSIYQDLGEQLRTNQYSIRAVCE